MQKLARLRHNDATLVSVLTAVDNNYLVRAGVRLTGPYPGQPGPRWRFISIWNSLRKEGRSRVRNHSTIPRVRTSTLELSYPISGWGKPQRVLAIASSGHDWGQRFCTWRSEGRDDPV